MKRAIFAVSLCLGLFTALLAPAGAQAAITEQEAHAIGVDAYLYFYPLVVMDITRKQSTNIEPGKEFGRGPMNMFTSVREYPPGDFKGVVRVNFDTLYSIAWLDMTKEPMIVSAPNTDGRYYLLPMLDMWTDVFASPGWRTTGTQAGNFLVTPPNWSGTVPAGMTRIDAPTPYVWIIGRTKTDGPPDYDAVHKIQDGYKVTPLSEWGKPAKPVEVKIDPSVDMKTPPKVQVDTMPAGKFFAYAAELLKVNPPHITDQPITAQLKKIGIEAGKSFDIDKVDPAIRDALAKAPEEGQQLMIWKLPTLARVANGWSMNTDTMGVYGNYYLKRAIIAQAGSAQTFPKMPFTQSIWLTNPASLWTEQTNTYCTSIRPPCRLQTPSGQSRSMTIKAFKSQTLSTGLQSVVGCRSSTTQTSRWISISRTKAPALTRRPTGFLRPKPRSI